jgi:ABC-2 type transport system permease protein
MNNQFSLFFPVVLFVLVGSLFYQEYKNKTYISWITYGYSKPKLFLAKVMVSAMIGLLFALIFLALFVILVLVLQAIGKVSVTDTSLTAIALGFTLEAFILVLVTISAGAIVINLGRNIIVSSVVGVIYGFASAFFIGSESGYVVPGGFAYRVAMFFSDKSTYYEDAAQATTGGTVSAVLVFAVLLAVGMLLFSRKRPIES